VLLAVRRSRDVVNGGARRNRDGPRWANADNPAAFDYDRDIRSGANCRVDQRYVRDGERTLSRTPGDLEPRVLMGPVDALGLGSALDVGARGAAGAFNGRLSPRRAHRAPLP
jgi:hypothetical protein